MSTQSKARGSQGRIGRPADEAKRAAIVRAAADSFFDAGYAATSIEQVAAAAGVSKVTVYNHFGDKRGLFTAAVERECEKMRGHFSLDDTSRGSLRQRLLAIGEAMSAFLSRPEMVQFERRIAAETEHEPAVGEAFLEAGPHRMKAAFTMLIQAMQAAGEVEVEDAELAAEQFAAMCKGMGDLDRRFGLPKDEERDRQRVVGAVDVFCAAYAAKGCDD
ncbi:TetR/AcrR family transcriptional regulator [Erythrobacter litoralis]|uniref:Transcriptional regulator n=1 Tax=Erythrobacter litoralis (strain HTCC2594) TaxID=314225 RepID=Q2N7P3_ERYLH|nr:TetR/AcrR family transcriptional regulator [Erythrobacter litoralis]ABC64298.1 transcriptional regulator [Erythrobacter litoralis HTCC2594]